jgi:anti-sigma regulatory factor (Ser/Thr protein kinase)
VPWDLRFSEPIVLEDGSKLATLRDAIAHVAKLIPKADRDMPEILTAAELLTNAAEHGGPVEFARIATLQAINRHVGRVFDPSRKDKHWGRQKLKRDEI